MQKLSFRTPAVYYFIITITLIISFISTIFSTFIQDHEILFAGALILFIGIPHGATDHLVFYSLFSSILKINFYLFYIFSTLAYALFWYLFPVLALNIFIAISAYHLGQSNLYYLSLPSNKLIKTIIYCCWGLFIIFLPIIYNFTEVTEITQKMAGKIWLINIENKECFLEIIIVLNLLIFIMLFALKSINERDLFRECLNLSVLGLLFYTTPLMLSFGVYFSIWHSLGSTFDQVQFLKKNNLISALIKFGLQSLPLSIISITIFTITFLNVSDSNIHLPRNSDFVSAYFFVFIATITLPHTIVRDKLYEKLLIKT